MTTTEKTSKASGRKKEIVREVTKLLLEQPIIGIIDMEGLPAAQQQKIKGKLRASVNIYMTKIPLINIAIKEASKKKPELQQLEQYVTGMTALLFTKENPFALYKTIKKSKSPAAAKPGQKAPKDIQVKAGPTSFAPGPIIGEFGALKIKAGIEGGKVVIKQDAIVAKEGEIISAPLASMLARLDIKPMEIGLNLKAVYEGGTVYTRSVLDVDEEKVMADIMNAAGLAHALSLELGIITKENVTHLLGKAYRQAREVGKEFGIINNETVDELLAQAQAQAGALQSMEKKG